MPHSKYTRLDDNTPPLCTFLRVVAVISLLAGLANWFAYGGLIVQFWGRIAAIGIIVGLALPLPLLCWFLAEHIEYRTWLARETLKAIDHMKQGGATSRENCEIAAKGLCYRVK